jgi:hypothetical protein
MGMSFELGVTGLGRISVSGISDGTATVPQLYTEQNVFHGKESGVNRTAPGATWFVLSGAPSPGAKRLGRSEMGIQVLPADGRRAEASRDGGIEVEATGRSRGRNHVAH